MRVSRLDGLRGVAALAVVFSHLAAGFRPRLYFGAQGGVLDAWQTWFATSPLFVLINGSFAVYIFFVLSGYVIAISVDRFTGSVAYASLARFVRLSIPCAASILLAAVVLSQGAPNFERTAAIVNHGWPLAMTPPKDGNLWNAALKDLLGYYYISSASVLNPVLWSMQKELVGSIGIIVVFRTIQSDVLRLISLVIISILTIKYNFEPYYYLCFTFGASMFIFRNLIAKAPSYASWAILAAGVFLGGKPFFPPPIESVYSIPYAFIAGIGGAMYIWTAGSILVVLGVLTCAPAARVLESPICQFLGRVSFGVYLIHLPLLMTLMATLFINFGQDSDLAFAGLSAIFIVAVYALAYAFAVYVDEPATRIARWVKGRRPLRTATA